MKRNIKKYLIIIFFFYEFIWIINIFNNKSIFNNKVPYNTSFISYQGKKILKSKLKNDYIQSIPNDSITDKQQEILNINNYYFNLDYYSYESSTKSELKKKFLDYSSRLKKKKIDKIDSIYISMQIHFGNSFISINNCIFYCQILGCNKIILKAKGIKRKWLLKNLFYIEKLGITIIHDSKVNCLSDNILCLSIGFLFPAIVIPEIKFQLFKKEILSNLPYVKIHPESLYIHIRGGDIFKTYNPHPTYAQPPLCFYQKIINNFKFKNIYIISIDRKNVIVNALLNEYKNIIHCKNDLLIDISILSHAYNIVLSVSSFAISSIKLNDNLRNIWEYDMMRLSKKIVFLHHHLYKFKIKYKIHTMKPSPTYVRKMFSWKCSSEQIKLMLKEKCPYEFVITKPNI